MSESIDDKKIEKIASVIHREYGSYFRYYTPTLHPAEISSVHMIGDVEIHISNYYEYIDIIGLTENEQNELEKKLTELKSRIKQK